MAKYQAGDKVVIRSDLQDSTVSYAMEDGSYSDIANYEMISAFGGKEVTIEEVVVDDEAKYYVLEEDDEGWAWTDEMFEQSEE